VIKGQILHNRNVNEICICMIPAVVYYLNYIVRVVLAYLFTSLEKFSACFLCLALGQIQHPCSLLSFTSWL
jgi:uncharacterized membrane protein